MGELARTGQRLCVGAVVIVRQLGGRDLAVVGAAIAVGVSAWMITMGSAPRYSYGSDQDLGNLGGLVLILLGSAAAGGLLAPRTSSWLTGLALGVPCLALAPWTAPRGDNDGLWLTIVPLLAVVTGVLVAVAWSASVLRLRMTPSDDPGNARPFRSP